MLRLKQVGSGPQRVQIGQVLRSMTGGQENLKRPRAAAMTDVVLLAPGDHQRRDRERVRGCITASCVDRDTQRLTYRKPLPIRRPRIRTMVKRATETLEAEVEHPGQQPRPAECDSGRVRAEFDAARLKWRCAS